MNVEILNNANIRYLNDLHLGRCLEKLILHCSYNNTIKWTSLYEITSAYTNWPTYNDEIRVNIYKHYRRIIDRLKSSTSTSSSVQSLLNIENCFDALRLSFAKDVYNRMAYYTNSEPIETDDEFYAFFNSCSLVDHQNNELTIIEAMIFLALYANINNVQLRILNADPIPNSPYPVEFVGRMCETFDSPKFFLPFLPILLNNFNDHIDNRIIELKSTISFSSSEQKKHVHDVIEFLNQHEYGGADILVFAPDICEDHLNSGNNIIEHTFLTNIHEYIVSFCEYILKRYSNPSSIIHTNTPHLCIDKNSVEKMVEEFSSMFPHVPVTSDCVEIAIGAANGLYILLNELKNEAFAALTTLPEFMEGLVRTAEHENFLYLRKLSPTKSEIKKQKTQCDTENTESSFAYKLLQAQLRRDEAASKINDK